MKEEANGRRELIRLAGVEKRYGSQLVLRIDELTVWQGDRIALVGSNGSGKSTLLRILAGVSPVGEGEARWAPELEGEPLGYVPQSGGLYGELTVQDNLELRRRLYGLTPRDVGEQPFLRLFGLTPFLQKPFSQLSGGYQRLAVVASALHVDPTWVLLDEPIAGVDSPKAAQVSHALDRLGERLRLLIITEQSPGSFSSPNRVIEVRDGRLRELDGGGA